MQKKLIALAIAGLSSAAFAQSNVTIYGVADASFMSAKAEGATQNTANSLTGINQGSRTKLDSNSSYLGFKGTEALGNGMSAVFQFEGDVNVDGGNAGGIFTGAGRDMFVGLSGGFGTVVGGRLSSPFRSVVASYEVAPGATGNGAHAINLTGKHVIDATVGAAAAVAPVTNTNFNAADRFNNAIAYVSPNFGGVTATVAYITGENRTPTPIAAAGPEVKTTAWGGSLVYANGPLKVSYAFQDLKEPVVVGNIWGGTTDDSGKLKTQALGAGYTFGGATTVNFLWAQHKANAGAPGANTVSSSKQNNYFLGIKHVMGAHEIAGSIAKNKAASLSWNGTEAAGLDKNTGAKGVMLRYGYNFSKRTQAYALYSKLTNDSNANYDFHVGSVVAATGVTSVGADPTSFGVGLRHSF